MPISTPTNPELEKRIGDYNKETWHGTLDLGTVNVSHHDTCEWVEEKSAKLFTKLAMERHVPVYSKIFRGFFETKNKDAIINFFTKGRTLYYTRYNNEYTENAEDKIWFGKNDVIAIGFSSEDNVAVDVHTTDVEFLGAAQVFMEKVLSKRTKDNMGKAHVLATGYDGLTTQELGVVATPLELLNYNESVREGVKEILADLKSQLPNGKLTIIEGEPGTGKTFLIRQLISEVPEAFFVIIPPAMVDKLGDPGVIPVLLRLKSREDDMTDEEMIEKADSETKSNPIVLIVEDADQCLVKRDGGNMGSIASVLNLTSGILGDLLDIRIIATTNAKKVEMDEAMLRDGRMSFHLEVGKLSFPEANAVYKRLLGKDDEELSMPDFGPVLLATVYKEAKRKGYRKDTAKKGKARSNLPKNMKRKIGFTP